MPDDAAATGGSRQTHNPATLQPRLLGRVGDVMEFFQGRFVTTHLKQPITQALFEIDA